MTIEEQKEYIKQTCKELDEKLPDIKFIILAVEETTGEHYISGNFCPRCAIVDLIELSINRKLEHIGHHTSNEKERIH